MNNKVKGLQILYGKEIIMVCAFTILMVLACLANFMMAKSQREDQRAITAALVESRLMSSTLSVFYQKPLLDTHATQKLNNRVGVISSNIDHLINGNPEVGIPISPIEIRTNQLAKTKQKLANVQLVLKNKIKVENQLQQSLKLMYSNHNAMAQILPLYEDTLSNENINTTDQKNIVSQYLMLQKNKDFLDTLNKDNIPSQNEYVKLNQKLKGIINNDSIQQLKKYDQGNMLNAQWVKSMQTILTAKEPVLQMIQLQTELQNKHVELAAADRALNAQINELIMAYHEYWDSLWLGESLGMVLAVMALLSILSLVAIIVSQTRQAVEQKKQEYKTNRTSVWRLTDEISHLADGDLTAHATIRDDITGAIAESVNYAIDALRRLVFTINQTAVRVSSSAQDAQLTSRRLVGASEIQVRKIVNTSAQIQAMAQSVEQVSQNAHQSAEVAKNSVSIAKEGADIVQGSIRGMDKIKHQIQQTAKQIKRLGESSQEIGSILALIDDITEQTNILALNASIQAAMAGEAGKGFAVVAEEVQRLAEKSNHATKQIEALIHTIQHDTQETVKSMEQTTSEVVAGSDLVSNAGIALGKIEAVSKELASLIDDISFESLRQTDAAIEVSQAMQSIKTMTQENADGTMNTAGSVGELAELAVELRDSVAGFKLPVQHYNVADDEQPRSH